MHEQVIEESHMHAYTHTQYSPVSPPYLTFLFLTQFSPGSFVIRFILQSLTPLFFLPSSFICPSLPPPSLFLTGSPWGWICLCGTSPDLERIWSQFSSSQPYSPGALRSNIWAAQQRQREGTDKSHLHINSYTDDMERDLTGTFQIKSHQIKFYFHSPQPLELKNLKKTLIMEN